MNREYSTPIEVIFDLLHTIHVNIRQMEDRMIRERGLARSEYRLLSTCPESRACSCKELARRLGLSVSRTSRILDQMVKKRLVIRRCDPKDRRRCCVILSQQGERIRRQILSQKKRWNHRLKSRYPDRELQKLIENLREISGISSLPPPDSK